MKQTSKRVTIVLSSILVMLALLVVPLVSVRAESVEVDYGYTYDFEIEDWGNYSELYIIEHDSEDNTYILGKFTGTVDMDLTSGVDNKSGNDATFLIKMNADGTYGWSRTWGHDYPSDLAIDSADNIYVTTQYINTEDFDPGAATVNKTSVSSTYDIGIIKLDSDGLYIAGYSMGGSGIDYPVDSTIDADDSYYVTGRFTGTADFDPGAGTDNKTSNGGSQDIFATKLNSDGTYEYTYAVGGSSGERGNTIAVAPNGDVYIGGVYDDTIDFDPGAGTDNKTPTGAGLDIYLVKLSAAGTYQQTTTFGNSSSESLITVDLDSAGNLYMAGSYVGTVDFNPGVGTDNKPMVGVSGSDSFLTKYNADGTYDYTYTWGASGSLGEYAGPLAIDRYDDVYVYMSYIDTVDADPTGGTDNLTSASNDHAVIKINADGSYAWATTTAIPDDGSYIYASDNAMSVDSAGDVYYGATFGGSGDLDPTAGVENFTTSTEDLFMTKIDQTILQEIDGLDAGLTATFDETDVTEDSIERGALVTINLGTTDNELIAGVGADFESDLDWSEVSADSDLAAGKAFAHNLTEAEGTLSSFTLYVPKLDGDNGVGICPGADSLEATNEDCDNVTYYEYGVDDEIDVYTVDSQEYWEITGMTGTGGFSATIAAQTGSDGEDDDALAETGVNQILLIVAASTVCAVALTGMLSREKPRKFTVR